MPSAAGGHPHAPDGVHDMSEEERESWKYRVPYKVHENDPNFVTKWRGTCHCGKVKYQLSRDRPLVAKFCHCTTCQRLHGSPFQWAAIFHKEDINFTHGHHDLGWYDPTETTTRHKLPCKVSCAYCRTPIMDEGRNMILLFPSLIEGINTPEGRKAFETSCHMFYSQRVVDIKDGKPKWTRLSDESDLLDEDGKPFPEEENRTRKAAIEEDNEKTRKRQKKENGSL